MLYVNKNNQINFSEQELDFLNNFSSVEEVINFCESQIENFSSLKNRLLTQSLREGIGDWLMTKNPKILTRLKMRNVDANRIYWGLDGKTSLHKQIDVVKSKLLSPNLTSETRERLLERKEELDRALRAYRRKVDLISTSENAIQDALINNEITTKFIPLPTLVNSRLNYEKIKDSVDANLALDLMDKRVPYISQLL